MFTKLPIRSCVSMWCRPEMGQPITRSCWSQILDSSTANVLRTTTKGVVDSAAASSRTLSAVADGRVKTDFAPWYPR